MGWSVRGERAIEGLRAGDAWRIDAADGEHAACWWVCGGGLDSAEDALRDSKPAFATAPLLKSLPCIRRDDQKVPFSSNVEGWHFNSPLPVVF